MWVLCDDLLLSSAPLRVSSLSHLAESLLLYIHTLDAKTNPCRNGLFKQEGEGANPIPGATQVGSAVITVMSEQLTKSAWKLGYGFLPKKGP